MPLQSPKETRDVATQIMSQMPAGQFPHLVEFATGRALHPGYAFGNEFGFCLELILDGLERAHLSAPAARSGRPHGSLDNA